MSLSLSPDDPTPSKSKSKAKVDELIRLISDSKDKVEKLKRLILLLTKEDDDLSREFVFYMRTLMKHHRAKGNVYTKDFSAELLKNICLHRSVKCATCLLEGECRLTAVDIDLNVVVEGLGLTPLHLAARSLCYDLTKLFLLYGANPNMSCHRGSSDSDREMLPLDFALEAVSNHQLVTDNWSLDRLPHTLIYIFFLKEMVEPLDTISLLASRTKREHLEKISLEYAKEGKVVKLTALLLVAWDTLMSPYAKTRLDRCPIGKCVQKEILSLPYYEEEMDDNSLERNTKLEAVWKMLELLRARYDGLDKYRHGLTPDPYFKKNPKDTFNHQVPVNVVLSMGMYPEEEEGVLDDVVFADLECFKPSLPPKEKALLYEALQNQKRSSAILHVPQLAHSQNGIVASLCSARQLHTSSKFNLRKELKGQLVAGKVEKPSCQQLATFRMCTRLVSIAKRGFK